jgi:hypothetical protein
VRLEEDLEIRIAAPPVFLATKWVAFDQRGDEDLRMSHDVEDVVAVVAARPEIVGEIRAADAALRHWLARRTAEFLADSESEDALLGALPDARELPGVLEETRRRLRAIAALARR